MENIQENIKVSRGRPRKQRPIEEDNDNNKEKRPRGRPRKPPPDPTLPKPPRKTKEISIWRDNRPLYFKLYYQNRPKEECACPYCGNKFDSKRNLNGHLLNSVICKRIRETQQPTESQELSNLD